MMRADRPAKRRRKRLIDGRTREAKRWRVVFAEAMRQTHGRGEALCRSYASLVVQREQLDARLARGELVNTFDLVRIVGCINRTSRMLGIVDDLPAEDCTQDAIRAITKPRTHEARA